MCLFQALCGYSFPLGLCEGQDVIMLRTKDDLKSHLLQLQKNLMASPTHRSFVRCYRHSRHRAIYFDHSYGPSTKHDMPKSWIKSLPNIAVNIQCMIYSTRAGCTAANGRDHSCLAWWNVGRAPPDSLRVLESILFWLKSRYKFMASLRESVLSALALRFIFTVIQASQESSSSHRWATRQNQD